MRVGWRAIVIREAAWRRESGVFVIKSEVRAGQICVRGEREGKESRRVDVRSR